MNQTIVNNIQTYLRRFPQVSNLMLFESNKPTKRLMASFIINGKQRIVHFGLRGAFTYADGASIVKRNSYRARASKIKNVKGQYTYLLPGTANSFAYHLLW